jgi:hypothetical protein
MMVKSKQLKIKKANLIAEHMLRLSFSDGHEQLIDFGPFLKKSLHPEIRKFLNPKLFKRFTIENGELMWGDFDLIFPIMDLYENKLDRENSTAGRSLKAAP